MTEEEIEEYETEFAGYTITGLYEEIKQLRIKIEEQEAQNEKLKCCVNCSKYHICDKETNWDKPTENHCKDWELVE